MTNIWGETGKRTVVVTKPAEPKPLVTDIDSLIFIGLQNIARMMESVSSKAKDGIFDREDVQTLKDLMAMLNELKKKQDDLLGQMSDEELEELAKS
jgi:hypothetical protein